MYQNGRRLKFLTPDEPPDALLCRAFSLPNEARWLGTFIGALLDLTDEANWEQYGDLTPEEAAQAYADIIEEALPGTLDACAAQGVPAPVWDEDSEVDDELPEDEQPWYGYVSNPEAPPDELEFTTQVGIWAITGFLAFATFEVGFAPAIAFAAIAPKFALAWQRGDVGEVIKIFVKSAGGDYEEAQVVDTSSWDEGDVRDITIIAGEDPEEREILVMAAEVII